MNLDLKEFLTQDILDRYDNCEYWDDRIIRNFWGDFHSILKLGDVIDEEDMNDFVRYNHYDLKEDMGEFLIYNGDLIFKLLKIKEGYKVTYVLEG